MDTATHHVRRLRWQARAADPAQALALRRLLRERSDQLRATMQQAFDEAGPADEVWQLPSLQLRVTVSDLASLESDFGATMARALRAALAELAWPEAAGERSPGQRSSALPIRQSVSQQSADAFWHYLATGLPDVAWAALEAPALQQQLQAAAVREAETVLSDSTFLAAIRARHAMPERIGMLLRWLALLPESLRRRWLQAHDPAPPWPAAIDAGTVSAETGLEAIALWLAWPDVRSPPPTATERRAAQDWLLAPRSTAARTLHALQAAMSSDTLPPPTPVRHLDRSDSPSAPRRTPVPVDPPPSSAEQALSVPLAGLVLLHPYLPRLLAACQFLSADGRAVPEAAYPRACALLHALAWGEGDTPEHQLPLIKLLLGRQPDAPLSAGLPLSPSTDLEEVDALLAAVRTHWSALRGSGADTLRLSFLQRPGLLSRQDGVWLLRMHSESFDMLLGLLPWSIGLVRLPWMPEPLVVEWPTP